MSKLINFIFIIILSIIFFLVNTNYIFSNYFFNQNSKNEIIDSLIKKNENKVSSTTFLDTIKLSTPLSQHGSFWVSDSSHQKEITKYDLLYQKYISLTNIIENNTNTYPLRISNFFNYNSLSFYGAQPNDISFRFNSRPLNANQEEIPFIDIFPCEFLEKIEIFTGSNAVIFCGSSGALINLQEIKYDTKTPYTRLWYAQGGYDFISADGIFSQNILKNTNFTFGFRRLGAKGKYDNNWNDLWNLRTLFRWNPNNETSISISHIFTNAGIGLNGGVDYINSTNYFNEYDAFVNYKDFNERIFKNDITLTISSILNPNFAFSSSIFYTSSIYDRYLPDFFLPDTNYKAGVYSNSSHDIGIIAKIENKITNDFFLNLGAETVYSNFPLSLFEKNNNTIKRTFASFLHSKINLNKDLTISGGLRLQYENKNLLRFYGGKINYKLINNLFAEFDYSYSEQAGKFIDRLESTKQQTNLFTFTLSYETQKSSSHIEFFFRDIKNPVIYLPIYKNDLIIDTKAEILSNKKIAGINLGTQFNFLTNFYTTIKFQWSKTLLNNENDGFLPEFRNIIDIYYQIKRGTSILNIGVEVEFLLNYQGYQFVPIHKNYIKYQNKKDFMWNGLKPYAIAKLGNANLRIELENAFSSGYYYVPVYPCNDRNLKLMLSWFFND